MRASLRATVLLVAGLWVTGALAQNVPPPRAHLGEPVPELYLGDSGDSVQDPREGGGSGGGGGRGHGGGGSGGSQDNRERRPLFGPQRERLVVLYFYRPTESRSVDAIEYVNNLASTFEGQGVKVFGFAEGTQEQVQGALRDHPINFDHFSSDGGLWRYFFSVSAFPRIYLLDTEGVLVSRMAPGEAFTERLRQQLWLTPPAESIPGMLQRRVDKAMAAAHKREYGEAYTAARRVHDMVGSRGPVGQAAANLLDEIESQTRDWLDEARQAVDAGNFEQATRILAEISVHFPKTELAEQAEIEVARLMGNVEVKPLMREQLSNSQGELLLDRATELESVIRYADAIDVYRRVLNECPDTQAFTQAKEAIGRIKRDPAIQKSIHSRRSEAQAARWVDIGQRFEVLQMFDKAREYYQRAIDEYPDARAVSTARQHLAKLPKGSAADDSADE